MLSSHHMMSRPRYRRGSRVCRPTASSTSPPVGREFVGELGSGRRGADDQHAARR